MGSGGGSRAGQESLRPRLLPLREHRARAPVRDGEAAPASNARGWREAGGTSGSGAGRRLGGPASPAISARCPARRPVLALFVFRDLLGSRPPPPWLRSASPTSPTKLPRTSSPAAQGPGRVQRRFRPGLGGPRAESPSPPPLAELSAAPPPRDPLLSKFPRSPRLPHRGDHREWRQTAMRFSSPESLPDAHQHSEPRRPLSEGLVRLSFGASSRAAAAPAPGVERGTERRAERSPPPRPPGLLVLRCSRCRPHRLALLLRITAGASPSPARCAQCATAPPRSRFQDPLRVDSAARGSASLRAGAGRRFTCQSRVTKPIIAVVVGPGPRQAPIG